MVPSRSLHTVPGVVSSSGEVAGLDQSAPASELWALFLLLHVLAYMTIPQYTIVILIDSWWVVSTLQRILDDSWTPPPTYWVASWLDVRQLVHHLRRNHDVQAYWVPSRGKNPLWSPPHRFRHLKEHWRNCNSKADTAATLQLNRLWRYRQNERHKWEASARWSKMTITMQARRAKELTTDILPPREVAQLDHKH